MYYIDDFLLYLSVSPVSRVIALTFEWFEQELLSYPFLHFACKSGPWVLLVWGTRRASNHSFSFFIKNKNSTQRVDGLLTACMTTCPSIVVYMHYVSNPPYLRQLSVWNNVIIFDEWCKPEYRIPSLICVIRGTPSIVISFFRLSTAPRDLFFHPAVANKFLMQGLR